MISFECNAAVRVPASRHDGVMGSCAAKPRSSDRSKILAFLDQLAANPNLAGDYEETDNVGRSVQIRVIGRYALTYWADHPVSEIKVTKIEKADS